MDAGKERAEPEEIVGEDDVDVATPPAGVRIGSRNAIARLRQLGESREAHAERRAEGHLRVAELQAEPGGAEPAVRKGVVVGGEELESGASLGEREGG